MAKLFIRDLAADIAPKFKLPQGDVEKFISRMFEVAVEGLNEDKQTKIKGLGTFKITPVKARESVNVSTGERVVIDGHDKVTFTPDIAMKELINKPFSQFETVVLEDGVDPKSAIENIQDVLAKPEAPEAPETQETPDAPEATDAPETPDAPETSEETESPKAAEYSSAPAAPEVSAPAAPEVSAPAAPEAIETPETPATPEVSAPAAALISEPAPKKNWLKILLIALFGLVCFGLGMLLGSHCPFSGCANNEVAVADSDTVAVAAVDSIAEVAEPAFDYEKVNADPRLKYGAYEIVDIDTVITLKEGQTMRSYCNATLGSEMIVYFQAVNGVDSMSAGGSLKVPKVKVKKRK